MRERDDRASVAPAFERVTRARMRTALAQGLDHSVGLFASPWDGLADKMQDSVATLVGVAMGQGGTPRLDDLRLVRYVVGSDDLDAMQDAFGVHLGELPSLYYFRNGSSYLMSQSASAEHFWGAIRSIADNGDADYPLVRVHERSDLDRALRERETVILFYSRCDALGGADPEVASRCAAAAEAVADIAAKNLFSPYVAFLRTENRQLLPVSSAMASDAPYLVSVFHGTHAAYVHADGCTCPLHDWLMNHADGVVRQLEDKHLWQLLDSSPAGAGEEEGPGEGDEEGMEVPETTGVYVVLLQDVSAGGATVAASRETSAFVAFERAAATLLFERGKQEFRICDTHNDAPCPLQPSSDDDDYVDDDYDDDDEEDDDEDEAEGWSKGKGKGKGEGEEMPAGAGASGHGAAIDGGGEEGERGGGATCSSNGTLSDAGDGLGFAGGSHALHFFHTAYTEEVWQGSLAGMMEISTFPSALLFDMGQRRYYLHTGGEGGVGGGVGGAGEWTVEGVAAFVRAFEAGTLSPHYRSQRLSAADRSGPLPSTNAELLHSEVVHAPASVVMFTVPWCIYCTRLENVIKEASAMLADRDGSQGGMGGMGGRGVKGGVRFYKIDAERNDLRMDGLGLAEAFPTGMDTLPQVVLFRAGSKPRVFNGFRSAEAILDAMDDAFFHA